MNIVLVHLIPNPFTSGLQVVPAESCKSLTDLKLIQFYGSLDMLAPGPVLKNLVKSFILFEILSPRPHPRYNFSKEMHCKANISLSLYTLTALSLEYEEDDLCPFPSRQNPRG